MPLPGIISTDGRPQLVGRLVMPRLEIDTSVLFLVDTGAEHTLLNADDSNRLQVDISDLVDDDSKIAGLGGRIDVFWEDSELTFIQHNTVSHTYKLRVGILRFNRSERHRVGVAPSLLGRNLLRNWKMRCDILNKNLEFDVLRGGQTVDLRAQNWLRQDAGVPDMYR